MVRERPSSYGAGWICGDPQDYDREYCVDLAQLSAFLHATQPAADLFRGAGDMSSGMQQAGMTIIGAISGRTDEHDFESA